MTKPREKTREEVTTEIEDGKKKIRQIERSPAVKLQTARAGRGLTEAPNRHTI